MFSSRTGWSRSENPLARRVALRRASGAPVFDLTETNPTRVGLAAPASILALLAHPDALAYAPDPRGLPDARQAVCADFGRRGVPLETEQIVLTASTSEAYALLFKLLCDPGDRILVPSPSYPLFEYLASLESVEVDHYPLAYDGEWHLSRDALQRCVTPRTRAVVAVHPNNPTGSFLKLDEAEALAAVCAQHDMALLSDEVFADYAFVTDPRRAGSLAGTETALTFALGGLSKSCGLPQLKLGWMAIGGPAALRQEAAARLEIVADTYLSVATPIQRAAPAILARQHELQQPIHERVAGNLERLREALAPVTAASLLQCEGGWSALVQVPATRSEDEWTQGLIDEGVIVHPGYFFEMPREAFLVLSLLPEPAVFGEGVVRLCAHVRKHA
jgi:alanine-synthesizing transaminase